MTDQLAHKRVQRTRQSRAAVESIGPPAGRTADEHTSGRPARWRCGQALVRVQQPRSKRCPRGLGDGRGRRGRRQTGVPEQLGHIMGPGPARADEELTPGDRSARGQPVLLSPGGFLSCLQLVYRAIEFCLPSGGISHWELPSQQLLVIYILKRCQRNDLARFMPYAGPSCGVSCPL